MIKSKKWLSLCMVLVLVLGINPKAMASEEVSGNTVVPIEQNASKPFLALGADLTAEQKAVVLGHMGLTEADLANCTVLTVSNDQEHQYLDNYVAPSIIGTKSLSSVLVKQAEKGNGVVVTTKNINYCTTGMYRNALLTAGVEDADILVAGPVPISGTAGLIGALKAYEEMSGTRIPDNTLDTALNELVTTGEIAAAAGSASSEDVEELVAFIKAKLANGELETDEDIKRAVEEGEIRFGVSLTDAEAQKIVDVMKKIDKLGLDPNVLLDQAKDLYDKFGDDLLNQADKALGEIFSNAVSGFFKELGNKISNFFKNLFS